MPLDETQRKEYEELRKKQKDERQRFTFLGRVFDHDGPPSNSYPTEPFFLVGPLVFERKRWYPVTKTRLPQYQEIPDWTAMCVADLGEKMRVNPKSLLKDFFYTPYPALFDIISTCLDSNFSTTYLGTELENWKGFGGPKILSLSAVDETQTKNWVVLLDRVVEDTSFDGISWRWDDQGSGNYKGKIQVTLNKNDDSSSQTYHFETPQEVHVCVFWPKSLTFGVERIRVTYSVGEGDGQKISTNDFTLWGKSSSSSFSSSSSSSSHVPL